MRLVKVLFVVGFGSSLACAHVKVDYGSSENSRSAQDMLDDVFESGDLRSVEAGDTSNNLGPPLNKQQLIDADVVTSPKGDVEGWVSSVSDPAGESETGDATVKHTMASSASDSVNSASSLHEKAQNFGADPQEQTSGTPNAHEESEAGRVGGPVSDTDPDDDMVKATYSSRSSENKSLDGGSSCIDNGVGANSQPEDLLDAEGSTDEGLKSSNPLVNFNPKQDGRMSPFDTDSVEGNDKNINTVRQFISGTMLVACHTMSLIDLLSTPIDICYGPWTKSFTYMCFINSCLYSLSLIGYSPELMRTVRPYFMAVYALPAIYGVYYLLQDPQCDFDIKQY